MAEHHPIQGELQAQLMATMWRLESATVEQVRSALPSRYPGAYTTVQTVLNRLAERGMLSRSKRGNQIVYAPLISESDYLSQSIEKTLSTASSEARQVALAQLIGGLGGAELDELQRLSDDIRVKRRRGKRP